MKSPKNHRPRKERSLFQLGAGILAGGLMFVGCGVANAATIVNESFESSPSSIFGTFNSYTYSQNYTSSNIPPSAGNQYYTGGIGATSTLSGSVSLLGSLTTGAIDAGLGSFSLSAYFSTYYNQNDWSSVTLQFLNGVSANIGSAFTIGGSSFVSALPGGSGLRDWGKDSLNGAIPVGARSAEIILFSQRLVGSSADGYVDLVNLDVSASSVPIPEPGTLLLTFLGGALLLGRKRPQWTSSRQAGSVA